MKKVIRTVWISLLSGLAFLVACTSHNGLTRTEWKQLKAERAELIAQIDDKAKTISDDPKILLKIRQDELKLRRKLAQVNQKLGEEPAISENIEQMSRLHDEMDSLREVIKASRESVRNSYRDPHICVYGPPR